MSEIVKKLQADQKWIDDLMAEASEAVTICSGLELVRRHISEAIAALQPGEPVCWIVQSATGRKFAFSEPQNVGHGEECFPVYRTPVAVDDAMVEPANRAYRENEQHGRAFAMKRALEAALQAGRK